MSSIIILGFMLFIALSLVLIQSQSLYESYGDYMTESYPYGFIQDDISRGNPVSWSNLANPRYPCRKKPTLFNLMHNPKAIRNTLVIQGHGVPLSYEEKTSPVKDSSMFYFDRHSVSPDCCPSNYSTDRGCVCWKPNTFYQKCDTDADVDEQTTTSV